MKVSAGTCIKYNNKLLFCHPTSSAWFGTYSPAKGGVNIGETFIDAAIRETKEEIGININISMISNKEKPIEIIYLNKKKSIHKKVFLFIVNINSLSEIGLKGEVVPKEQLQKEEVDWAGFLTKEEILKKSFHRFLPLIELLS
jgi:ADP-ribose pyrophosphatase YjhB (NUDIX family)